MKAKDTVMSNAELEENIRKDFEKFTIKEEPDYIQDILIWTREAQAEISFQAGIKEVVDWLINDSYDTTIHFGDDWEVKLKEWGINT